ncbi:hypothetical protein J2Z23_004496 [Lederbergia galactosidilyticus]|nr:hypothetical protein [Lederbergia galactosidilytica]
MSLKSIKFHFKNRRVSNLLYRGKIYLGLFS